MLTRNGKLVVACGVGLYAAAWGFGTAVMYPVAVGLILAPWLAALWVRTMRRPLRLRRTVQRGDLVEGVDLRIGIEVRTGGGPLPARAVLVDQVDGMRPLETPLYRRGAVARGGHLIHSAPRGRYRLSSALVRISDPFWLAETQVAVERVDVVIVYPQVVPLEGLFTDAGSAGGDVNRALLHRSSGYDLHSIRDFQQGESLRRVHWPSTAKRRRLMVKEMHDAPRDEACVLLDGDSSAEVGEPGQSSFDVAVRSAASVLARLVDAGQRCSLIVHGETRQRVRVGSAGIEWADALGVLAVARARAPRPLSAFLGESMTGGADPIDAARVFIVTAGLTPALAERLMALRSAQRDVAVVWIDAATFAGGRTPTGVDAAALRLARSGFALTRVRSGDDLRVALSHRPCGRSRMRKPAAAPWLILAGFLAFGGWHWAHIETPPAPAGSMILLSLLAGLPVLVATTYSRVLGYLVTLPVCAMLAAGSVSGIWPGSSGAHVYPRAIWRHIDMGAHAWFGVTTPFDRYRFVLVDHDVRLAYFGIAVVLAWLVVDRRAPLPSIGVAFALFAMPSTILHLHASGFRAAIFLGLALIALRLLPPHEEAGEGAMQAVTVGAAVIVAGLVVATLPGVAKGAFLDWHTWNPLAGEPNRVAVSYVWNPTYQPLIWPKKKTPVLLVTAPRPMYWKVATLNQFEGDTWQVDEPPAFVPLTPGTTLHVAQTALPTGAQGASRSNKMTITVKVLALADQHLVGAGQPIVWNPPSNVQAVLTADGDAIATHDLDHNATYTMQGYAPDPSAQQLEAAGSDFPTSVLESLAVNGQPVPLWHPGQKPARLPPVGPDLRRASDQVWKRSGAIKAKNEWSAAAEVEAYLRSKPFVYDLKAVYKPSKGPVLAQFLLTKHRGYCQMFAGAMALVLRLHGIPTRVAVGFTTGQSTSKEGGAYLITDHNAHMWVETYFPHWGWQPFEPTPGDVLPVQSSTSNAAALGPLDNTLVKQGSANLLTTHPNLDQVGHRLREVHGSDPTHGRGPRGVAGEGLGGTATASHRGRGFLTAVLILAVVLAAILAVVKFAAVRWRYLRRGPRQQASAAYHELSTFLGDQGVVPVSSRTFEDLAHEINRWYAVDASGFAASASRARYGPAAGAGEAESEMRSSLRRLKRQIRKQISRRDRLSGALRMRAALAQSTTLD